MAEFLVALEDLYPPGSWACAHRAGDDNVPAENVERNGWQDKVAKPGTKKAEAVTATAVSEG